MGDTGCGSRPMHSSPIQHHLAESTVALARKASSGCSVMVYTSHVHAAGNRDVSAQTLVRQLTARAPPPLAPVRPATSGSIFAPRCQAALLSPDLAEPLRAANLADEAAFPWEVIPLQITGQNSADARIASKIAKMAPFLLFPRADAVVFVDFKLALKLPAKELVAHALAAQPGRGRVAPSFAAMQHPCVADTPIPARGHLFAPTWCRSHSRGYDHGWSARAWMIREARMIAADGKTRNATRLQAAVEQYARHVPNTSHLCKPSPVQLCLSCGAHPACAHVCVEPTAHFACTDLDGGLLIWRNSLPARRLACQWAMEFLYPKELSYPIDRDQPSMAFLLNQPNVIDGVHLLPPLPPACGANASGAFCGWDHSPHRLSPRRDRYRQVAQHSNAHL